MNSKHLLWAAALMALVFSCNKDSQLDILDDAVQEISFRGQVVLPAGSVDGLAAAIAAAGPNGTVIVQSGTHYLNAQVDITHRITIKGQPGAVMILDVPVASLGDPSILPAIYLNGAGKTVIEGISFQAAQDPAGTAILVFNSSQVTIRNNSFSNFQFSVLIERSPQVTISGNTIASTLAWLTGEFFLVHGVVVINGAKAHIRNNAVSNSYFGVWACDNDGIAIGNEFYGNVIGLIFCTVPPGSFALPNGEIVGSLVSATKWTATNNNAHDNFETGYLVIDGANNIMMSNNQAFNNAAYDIELAGETGRYGFIAPTSYNNRVIVGGANAAMTVKDCGLNNTVIGGTPIDTAQDPCF